MNVETYSLSKKILDTISKKKFLKLELFDVGEITSLASAFIIATVSNNRQTKAIADDIDKKFKGEDIVPIRVEGYQTANWILLDYGDLIVHILDEEHADFYRLNSLWRDGICLESY